MDDLDRRLLHTLTEDLPLDFARLAPVLGTTEQDAASRYKRLRDRGVVQECVARVSPGHVGVGFTAFLLVRVTQTAANYHVVRQMLADLEVVEEAHAVSGEFDWLLKVRCASLGDVQMLVAQKLSLVPGYIRAQTCMVLDSACDYVNADVVRLGGDGP
jgi:Lrp/AsnC family transcriptional regulator, leucine-responsive regulatory protein